LKRIFLRFIALLSADIVVAWTRRIRAADSGRIWRPLRASIKRLSIGDGWCDASVRPSSRIAA